MKRKSYNNHLPPSDHQPPNPRAHFSHSDRYGRSSRYHNLFLTPPPSTGPPPALAFIPLHGNHGPPIQQDNFLSRKKAPQSRGNRDFNSSSYHNGKRPKHRANEQRQKQDNGTPNIIASHKKSPSKGSSNSNVSSPSKVSNSSEVSSLSAKTQVIVVVDEFSPERSDAKRRKIITIESDDEGQSTVESIASSSKQSSSDSGKNKQRPLPTKYRTHLTSALQNYYSDHKQDKALFDRKVFLRDGIQQIVRKTFGEGLMHLTGSSMSGFGTLKSDADMALVFDPNVTEMAKKKSRNVISRLAGCLRRQAFCTNVEMIFAKVPIVKFFDRISECDVDININNIVGIKNSFLLRAISLVDTRIAPLVIVIKAWAKSHGINSAFQGSLSSYCLVTMITYFLQTGVSPPILPPLKSYVDNLISVNVNTQLQNYVPKTFIKFEVRNKEELGEIFVKFFQFWIRKFRQNKVFSVYKAEEKIRSYNEPFLDTSSYVLVLEEPFQKDNIARAVRPQQFDDVKSKFQQACEQFQDITSFDALFDNLG